MEPLGDGPADPLDDLDGPPLRVVEYGTYDVTTLGLDCAHGDGCAARAEAV